MEKTKTTIEPEYGDQLSLFDLELPPNNEESLREFTDDPLIIPPKESPVNFAKVPDSEFTGKKPSFEIPTINDLLKVIDRGSYKTNRHEFLSDVFECGAIAVSNRFDLSRAEEREQRYLTIIKKYDRDMQQLLVELFSKIYILLSQQINQYVGFNDYLGELYMRSETSNSHAGQFFTPYCVSKMCAEVVVGGEKVFAAMENDEILTLTEPACGSGGMVLAAADVLYNNYHFNISRNLLVECSDIDSRCVHMSYLQLGLAGIPAIIYRRNTLTMETWERWETPAYIMQWLRFKDRLKP